MLLKKMWSHYKEANELDEIMLSFDQAGIIKIESIGNQVIYIMPDNQVQEYKRIYSGKDSMIIPLPTHVEREVSDDVLDYRWIREYWFDAVDWKCAVCGSVMFGMDDLLRVL